MSTSHTGMFDIKTTCPTIICVCSCSIFSIAGVVFPSSSAVTFSSSSFELIDFVKLVSALIVAALESWKSVVGVVVVVAVLPLMLHIIVLLVFPIVQFCHLLQHCCLCNNLFILIFVLITLVLLLHYVFQFLLMFLHHFCFSLIASGKWNLNFFQGFLLWLVFFML